jgi:anti-sigma B factor antagonist
VGTVVVLRASRSLTFDQGNLGLRRQVAAQLDAGARVFVVDVSGVVEIDSYGVAELVSCHTAVTRADGRLVLCAASPKVRQVLAVTRLDSVIESFESEPAALAALGPPS